MQNDRFTLTIFKCSKEIDYPRLILFMVKELMRSFFLPSNRFFYFSQQTTKLNESTHLISSSNPFPPSCLIGNRCKHSIPTLWLKQSNPAPSLFHFHHQHNTSHPHPIVYLSTLSILLLESQYVVIQVIGCIIRLANIQCASFQMIDFDHLALYLTHQLLCYTHSSVRTAYCHWSDVSHLRNVFITILSIHLQYKLHFTENIAHNLSSVIHSHKW